MADIFVSYKRDERPAIEQIAARFRELGLTVWFDAGMSAGDAFSDEIDREARGAKAILVCWSPTARDSRWVKAEAMIGFEQDKLAACYVAGPDAFSAPTPFNASHAEDLRSWLAAPSDVHSGWKSVLRRIGRLCGREDIESWGALDAQANASELRAWIANHEASPLFMTVEALLREREGAEADRTRLETEARQRRVQEEAKRRAAEAADEARQEAEKSRQEVMKPQTTPRREREETRHPPKNGLAKSSPFAAHTLAMMVIAGFAGASMRTVTNVTLMPMIEELALTDSQAGLISNASIVGMVLFALLGGVLSDRSINQARLVAVGVVLASGAALAIGFAQNLFHLLLLRALVGAGGGLILVPALVLAGRQAGSERPGTQLAAIGIGVPLAVLVSTFAGAALAENLGWRNSHMVYGGLSLACVIPILVIARGAHLYTAEGEAKAELLGSGMLVLLLAVFVHAGFVAGSTSFLMPYFARTFGVAISELRFMVGLPVQLATILGLLLAASIADSMSKSPHRYADIFLICALLSGVSLFGMVWAGGVFEIIPTSPTIVAAVFAATHSMFAGAWYGCAFAMAYRTGRPSSHGLIFALIIASYVIAGPVGAPLLGSLSDQFGLGAALAMWSGVPVATALLLVVLRTMIRNRMGDAGAI